MESRGLTRFGRSGRPQYSGLRRPKWGSFEVAETPEVGIGSGEGRNFGRSWKEASSPHARVRFPSCSQEPWLKPFIYKYLLSLECPLVASISS